MSKYLANINGIHISTYCGPDIVTSGYGSTGRILVQVDVEGKHVSLNKECVEKLIKVLQEIK